MNYQDGTALLQSRLQSHVQAGAQAGVREGAEGGSLLWDIYNTASNTSLVWSLLKDTPAGEALRGIWAETPAREEYRPPGEPVEYLPDNRADTGDILTYTSLARSPLLAAESVAYPSMRSMEELTNKPSTLERKLFHNPNQLLENSMRAHKQRLAGAQPIVGMALLGNVSRLANASSQGDVAGYEAAREDLALTANIGAGLELLRSADEAGTHLKTLPSRLLRKQAIGDSLDDIARSIIRRPLGAAGLMLGTGLLATALDPGGS